jgi:hypothetical protein
MRANSARLAETLRTKFRPFSMFRRNLYRALCSSILAELLSEMSRITRRSIHREDNEVVREKVF